MDCNMDCEYNLNYVEMSFQSECKGPNRVTLLGGYLCNLVNIRDLVNLLSFLAAPQVLYKYPKHIHIYS